VTRSSATGWLAAAALAAAAVVQGAAACLLAIGAHLH
jgi:hypothetical protein